MKHLPIFILLFLIQHQSFAQPTPHQMVEMMGRGINMGNVLSAPVEGNWAPVFTETYFQDVASAGFKTVRIPMDFFGKSIKNLRTSSSTKDDFPAPPVPVIPRTGIFEFSFFV